MIRSLWQISDVFVDMKVVIAIDAFKGSISSVQAGEAVRRGILSACPDASITVLPLADGGEGFMDAVLYGCGGEKRRLKVTGPLGETVDAEYGVDPSHNVAFIETAQAIGLSLIEPQYRDPLNTTTFGVGELINDALDLGCREFLIGLGGSSTNDAGVGMLSALGYCFFDSKGSPAGICGKDVINIAGIDRTGADPRLAECSFVLASDVTNPLCGAAGASFVFGPQKGATPEIVVELDAGLSGFAAVTEMTVSRDFSCVPGAGAAGGLGFAFMAYLNASMRSGVEVVLDAVNMENAVKDADYIITGEGMLDSQTIMGKAPFGVAALAKKYAGVVIALPGSAADNARVCNDYGIDAYFPVVNEPLTLHEAMSAETVVRNLETTAKQVFLLINAVRSKS